LATVKMRRSRFFGSVTLTGDLLAGMTNDPVRFRHLPRRSDSDPRRPSDAR
jgi:hypothetical protein